MADKETGLQITVGAVADEKSADNATKQIVSRVFDKLKEGAIKLPINSKLDKADLRKLDDSMKQARKEVVSRYNKLLKDMDDPKGFDAFSDKAIKDLVELGKAYSAFNSKASGRSKNNLAAIYEVKAALGDVFQLYESEVRALNSKIKELGIQEKVAKKLVSTRPRRKATYFGPHSEEEIDANIKQHKERQYKLKYKDLAKIGPKGPGGMTRDLGSTSDRLLSLSEYSAHGSNWANKIARIMERDKERAKKSLKIYKDASYVPNGKDNIIGHGNIRPSTTEREEIAATLEDAKSNLSKLVRLGEAGNESVTVESFLEQAAIIKTFSEALGKPLEGVKNSIVALIESHYELSSKKRIGATKDSNKEQGVGPGHERMKGIMSQFFKTLDAAWESELMVERMRKDDADPELSRIIARHNEHLEKMKAQMSETLSRAEIRTNEAKGEWEYKNNFANLQESLQNILATTSAETKVTQTQLSYDKVENVREAVADSNEEVVTTEHKNINRDVAKTVKADAATGFNTEAKADELVSISKEIATTVGKALKVTKDVDETGKAIHAKISNSPDKDPEVLPQEISDETELKPGQISVHDIKRLELIQDAPDPKVSAPTEPLKRPHKKQPKEPSLPRQINAPSDISRWPRLPVALLGSGMIPEALASATHLGLPKADGRRKYPSKGLIDETPPKPGALMNIGAPLRTVMEDVLSLNVLDEKRLNREARIKHGEERKTPLETDDTIEAKAARSNLPALVPGQFVKIIKEAIGLAKTDIIPMVKTSEITASIAEPPQSIWEKFIESLFKITKATEDYSDVITSTAEQQDQLAAERIQKFGLNNGRNPNDTGDIASIKRALELFRTNKRSIEDNPELAQKLRLTDSVKVDTTEVAKKLSNALSGKEMRNAQMGGSIPRQILGAMTGFIGMPSIEKSRAQADGLNQILGNVNKSLNAVLNTIQTKETELRGMEKSGQVKFSADGRLVEGSSAAKKTFADLEESKLVLRSILADMEMVDAVVEQTGGKFSKMVKLLNFTSPVLRENNTIIRNVGSGLDKNGKALKYQSRLAEILNYTFQLMGRSIGQMLKSWLSQLNPITQIKNMFNDFASYNVKWQRTLNVVKYNLRSIILPIMDKIAQLLTNMIGFADIILQKVQAAFGHKPISLFDQENADKFKKEMEEIQSISAGFDELHDIGSGGDNDANNFFGEIYKPELSQEWIDLANRIGDLFAGIIKGDLGFGEVMKEILGIAIEGITLIGKEIWNALKSSGIAKYIEEQWASILATLAGMFIGWQLLKVAGKLVFKAITSHLTGTALGKSLDKLGTKFTGWISKLFTGKGLIGAIKAGGASLGTVFASAFVAIAASLIGGSMVVDAFGDAADKTSYNIGLDEVGGKDSDKKGIGGQIFQGTAGGAITGAGIGFALGGPLGAAIGAGIGAIAGAFATILAPAIEGATVRAKELNNEMQKIEYYQGKVQGLSTAVAELEEMETLLKKTLDEKINSLYTTGEQLGINRTRMDELTNAALNGTYTIDMLNAGELTLHDRLVAVAAQQVKNTEATAKLEAAKRKLEKAELDLAIAEDVAAGNFEMAAARIEYAEAATLYTAEEAAAKRIQVYKQAGEEEARYLLQDLTPEQKKKMLDINKLTEDELVSFVEKWRDSSDSVKRAFLSGVDANTQSQFDQQLNQIDSIIREHQGFWSGVGDTLAEIFTFGIADTWTYNGNKKGVKVYRQGNTTTVSSMAVGTNYVPNDGLAYLHQGEAVIPKKYNRPYEPGTMSQEERAYMTQMLNTIRTLDNTMKQGITVNGQFTQRGSDLVAVVNRTRSQTGADLLSNVAYAR